MDSLFIYTDAETLYHYWKAQVLSQPLFTALLFCLILKHQALFLQEKKKEYYKIGMCLSSSPSRIFLHFAELFLAL